MHDPNGCSSIIIPSVAWCSNSSNMLRYRMRFPIATCFNVWSPRKLLEANLCDVFLFTQQNDVHTSPVHSRSPHLNLKTESKVAQHPNADVKSWSSVMSLSKSSPSHPRFLNPLLTARPFGPPLNISTKRLLPLLKKTSIGSETATEWINKQDLDQNVLENVWAKCKFCLITGSLVLVDHWQLGLLLIVVGQLAGNTLPFGSAWNFFVTIFPVTVRPKRHYDSMSAKQRGMLAWEMLMNSDCVKQWLTNGVKQSLPTSTWCETTERESGSTFQTSWGAIFWFIHPSEQTEFNRTKTPKRPEAPNR